MRVTLVASTSLDTDALRAFTCYVPHPDDGCVDVADADELAEFAGRQCYESWGRPNPDTATNQGYVANIVRQRHFSVLEHASATFLLEGVSRSLTHELVRHRHLSFSQVSQRYVDETNAVAVRPPAMSDGDWELLADHMRESRERYEALVDRLVGRGTDRKTARGAARSVLPNATETALVVTGNMRTWREVLEKRLSPAADAEIRVLAVALLEKLWHLAPATFADMVDGRTDVSW